MGFRESREEELQTNLLEMRPRSWGPTRSQGERRKTRSCSRERERGRDPLGGGNKTRMETHALALTVGTVLLAWTGWAQEGSLWQNQ